MTAPRRPIRVAFCLDTFGIGGTELNAIRTAEQFDPAEVEVHFVCLARRGPLLERVQAGGWPVHDLAARGTLAVGTHARAFRTLQRLRGLGVEVVHAHDIYSNMICVPWARALGFPLVIASRRWWTATNHPVHPVLNRLAYRLAHRVLANSASVAALVRARDGVAAARTWVVPNFVEAPAFTRPDAAVLDRMRAAFGLAPGTVAIGIVANLRPVKDHATLLGAFARVAQARPDVRLVLVGDGPERPRLEAMAGALGIGARACFAGHRPHQPSPHWGFDVSVLASRGEGFPNALVEAMAAGRPIVATAVGGVPDVVADGTCGLLVPAGDAPAMAAALARLVDDPSLRHRMGAEGLARAGREFLAAPVVARLVQLYRSQLGGPAR